MPKIGPIHYVWHGKRSITYLYYSKRHNFYIEPVPQNLEVETDMHFSGFSTEADITRAFAKAVAMHHELTKHQRKVIAYKMLFTTDLAMEKIGDGHWSGSKPWVPKVFGERSTEDMPTEGYGFVIQWYLYMEVQKETLKYYSIDSKGELSLRDDYLSGWVIIDWTPEREQAFREIEKQMETMVKKLCAIVGNNDAMIKLLDSGAKLLTDKAGR